MKASDLKFNELFELRPQEGTIGFAGGRMLLMDAESVGRLRELLIGNLGEAAARALLSQYGYTSGYYDALKLQKLYDWDSHADWVAAGPVIHTLEGIVQVIPQEFVADRDKKLMNIHGIWRNSYEAEQHKAVFGVGSQPVCWTLTSYASGYCTAYMGVDCICVEEKCVGRGDSECYFHIKKKEDWGPEAAPYIHSIDLLTTNKNEFKELLAAAGKR